MITLVCGCTVEFLGPHGEGCNCGDADCTTGYHEMASSCPEHAPKPETRRLSRLMELLKKAQDRLRNQGDVKPITEQLNLRLYDEIEAELGGKLFLGTRAGLRDARGAR